MITDAFAYKVTWERINPQTGRTEIVVSGYKGTRSHASAAVMLKSNFAKLVKIEPLTAEQYDKEFPPETRGRTGRFVSVRA
jgi:hypothetical protein